MIVQKELKTVHIQLFYIIMMKVPISKFTDHAQKSHRNTGMCPTYTDLATVLGQGQGQRRVGGGASTRLTSVRVSSSPSSTFGMVVLPCDT